MVVGGLGNYNPDLIGFREDNQTVADWLNGWMDVVEAKSNGYQRDNIDALLHTFTKSGNYGGSWVSFVEASDLPSSPAMGRGIIGRINLDDTPDTYRLYWYSGTNWIIISSGNA